MTSRNCERANSRGAAAVEFVLVLPLLVAILFGTIDWGYYFFTREIIVNAAREGARVGTLQFGEGVDRDTQAQAAAERYLTNVLHDVAQVTVPGTPADGSGCPAESCCVSITYEIGGSVTGFLGDLVPHQITAYAEMRR